MEELKVTQEMLEEYLDGLRAAGLAESSYLSYQTKFRQLYQLLPEDKTIRQGTIVELGEKLKEQGYSPASINVFFSATDGLLAHYGFRNLQTSERMAPEKYIRPELSRNEYWRLLFAARSLGKRKTFYLLKTFATLGVSPKDLSYLTVEAVNAGNFKSGSERIYIPAIFRDELLSYIKAEKIEAGPIFVGNGGKPLGRTSINNMFQRLQRDARVAAEKCNPSCLQMLYRQTKEELENRVRFLVEFEYNRLLQDEKYNLTWDNRKEAEEN